MTNDSSNLTSKSPNALTTPDSTSIEIIVVPALQDNYCYLVHRKGSPLSAVIDTSEASAIDEALESHDLKLGLILNTHHHHDHVGGNTELVDKWNVDVYCSTPDVDRIPQATRGFADGESFEFDGIHFEVISIPGHTKGQIAFYVPAANALFVGDTVFSMGCGRLLEGTAEQMWRSLELITGLPQKTQIYFGHEYTEKNGAFASNVEPNNSSIQARLRSTREALSAGRIPAAPTIQDELKSNPFLRLSSAMIRRQLGLESATDLEVFTSLRRLRDVFQG